MMTNNIAVRLGERVRTARLETNTSRDVIARALGITEDQLDAAERGDAPLTPAQITDLCTLLNRQPSDLLDGLAG